MARRSKSDGIRITKVGLWYIVFLVIIVVAATNTGNNGLFLILATMGGALVVSEIVARINVRGLAVELRSPREVFANSPAHLALALTNRSRLLPRWLLLLSVEPEDIEPSMGRPRRRPKSFLAAHLPRRGAAGQNTRRGQLELTMPRRGRWAIRRAHVTSLFPLGLFRKGRRYLSDLELLVYPEILSHSESRPPQLGKSGNEPTRRPGWGHELLGLRTFREGDDPRSIHWKQTARTGGLIFKQHETEEARRLMLVFDNAVGELADDGERARFEHRVSEAATAALDYLEDGYEVSLLTRDVCLPFAAGPRQRLRVLETLALIEAQPAARKPLAAPDVAAPHLLLAMEPDAVTARPLEREAVA